MINWISENRKDVIIAAVLFAVYLAIGLLTGDWGGDTALANIDPLA